MPATLSFTSGTLVVTEGDDGAHTVEVSMALSSASTETVEVDLECGVYSFSPDRADPDVDFDPFTQTLTFAPGETERTFEVTYYGDTLYEQDERFWVKMVEARGAEIDPDVNLSTQSIIIQNDDEPTAPTLSFTSGTLIVTEGDEGAHTVEVSMALSSASTETVEVDLECGVYSFSPDRADPDVDFDPFTRTLTFAPGETERTFEVTYYGDTLYEQDERFWVKMVEARGAEIDPDVNLRTQSIIIQNDDPMNSAPQGEPVIDGLLEQNSELSADTSGVKDEDGIGSFSFQWLRDGVAISEATGEKYTLRQEDVGTAIKVIASYTDGRGAVESVSSSASATVTNVNDGPTGEVAVLGDPKQGETVAVDTALLADEDGLGGLSYQWLRDGHEIADEVERAYTLTAKDVGSEISVLVSYTDGYENAETVLSSATSIVEGDLIIVGNGKDNELSGGAYNDRLNGRGGDDTLKAYGGEDALLGGKGADSAFGGAGSDVLKGGAGDDLLSGQGGGDRLVGAGGHDTLLGGTGNDVLLGGGKNDRLIGHGGADELDGGAGGDELLGGGGKDTLFGGGGQDRIQGQKGGDVLEGGSGRDTFFFNRGDGKDIITDFELGVDHIEIGRGASGLGQLHFEQVGDDVVVSFRNVDITVENTTVDELAVSDHFLFV